MPTIEDQLRGRPESVAEMFGRILSTACDRGHVDVEIIAKGVVLHGSGRIFAGLGPRDRGLGGMLNLLAPRQDPRFTKVEPLTKRIWHHRFFLTDPRQLEGAASRQRHPRPPRPRPDGTSRSGVTTRDCHNGLMPATQTMVTAGQDRPRR